MAKVRVHYQCNECGASVPKWAGQCPECHAWNTLLEVISEAGSARSSRFRDHQVEPAAICYLDSVEATAGDRISTGLGELDRAIGGGLVDGSVTLLGGDPGIGKSTLLIQVLAAIGGSGEIANLYVSGEESAQQIGLRGRRLGLGLERLRLLTENNLERILALAAQEKPAVLVIDSIQTMYTELLQSAPGAVAQVRECAAQLVRYAKQTGTTVLLVGHVTKEGALAGPRVLEHMVDTVLYFEGESSSRYRVIRSVKNRYGAVNELGVFAMTDKGLREVSNPSAIFLSRHEKPVSGSVVMVTREGTRPLLVEVQALVDESHLANPRRVTVGLEQNRLAMLLAVLHRHAGVATFDQDVFVNVVGGVRIAETAADLAVVLAVISSLRNIPLPRELVVFGEVGLAGEIRPVQNGPERLNEAAKHGFKQAIIPQANKPRQPVAGLEITAVNRLPDALDRVMN
ncbi:MAG TPA: DNA repair protein RadA [Gammaproteobacteria bacterium]|nr:DNA repair protein RadA [Gammaproteobacteria bacterium]